MTARELLPALETDPDARRQADEWRAVTLGDCAVINDATYSPKEAWPVIHYLDTGNVTDNRIVAIRRLVPGTDKIPSRARHKVQPGDIVYSTVRPDQRHFGLLKDPPDNLLVSTAFAVIRGKAGVAHTDFLYWFLAQRHVVERLHTIAEHSVSTYPSIRPDDIARLEFRLPPLPEQRRIAHVLGTLDDKIALNRRLNATLEDMARALFKSWFVDFDPVHAKAALKRHAPSPVPELVEGLNVERTGTATWTVERARAYLDGMDPEVAALFPDGFKDSVLGQIPKGWKVKTLPEVMEINPSRALRKGEIAPYLDMANMPTEGHVPGAVVARPFGSGMRFVNGDTLLARITPCLENGKTAYVDFLEDGQVGWGSTEYIVLRPKPPFPNEFAYCLARSTHFRGFAIQSMTGSSGRQRVPAEALTHYLMPLPAKRIVGSFGRIVGHLLSRANDSVSGSSSLTLLRDTLLPKLLSGDRLVRDV